VSTAVRVSAIVVHYRAEDCLPQCLDALLSNQREPVEVICVDNASLSEPQRWQTAYPRVRWVLRSRNQGFGTAANEGARAAEGEFLLVLNSDAWPIDGALDQMVDFLSANPGVAAVSPLLFSPTGDPQPVLGVSAPTLGRMLAAKLNRIVPLDPLRVPTADASGAVELQWPSGAVMLCRRRAWDDVGGFDEGFFLYFEDLDLGDRLGAAGWQNVYVPSAVVCHTGGHATSRNAARMAAEHHRSAWRYLSRRYAGWRWLPLRVALRVGLGMAPSGCTRQR